MTNTETFQNAYLAEIAARQASGELPQGDWAQKMLDGIISGDAAIDGPACKAVCKTLGLKNTYKAIAAYLAGESAAPATGPTFAPVPRGKVAICHAGERVDVPGRYFSHYIAGIQFWFALHDALDHVAKSITHADSGMRVCLLGPTSILAALGDEMLAARSELDRVIDRVGAARLRSVMAGAKPIRNPR